MNALDLFAGPGGWDAGASELGIDPLGIEWDDAACKTRAAAGLRTLQGDVAALDPRDFAPCDLQWDRADCPAPTVTAGGSDNGGPEVFGRGGGVTASPELSKDAGQRSE